MSEGCENSDLVVRVKTLGTMSLWLASDLRAVCEVWLNSSSAGSELHCQLAPFKDPVSFEKFYSGLYGLFFFITEIIPPPYNFVAMVCGQLERPTSWKCRPSVFHGCLLMCCFCRVCKPCPEPVCHHSQLYVLTSCLLHFGDLFTISLLLLYLW